HHRGSQSAAFLVGDDGWITTLHYRHHGIRRSEVDTNHLRHVVNLLLESLASATRERRGGAPPRPAAAFRHLRLYLLVLYRLHLGKRHRQHAVPVAGLHVVGLHGDRELKDTLHASCPALATEVVLRLDGLGILALAPEAQHVSRDRYLNVLLAHAGKVHLHHQLVLRLVHVRGRSPRTLAHPRLCLAAAERV